MYSRQRNVFDLTDLFLFDNTATTTTAAVAANYKNNKLLDTFQWDRRERVETPDGDFFHVDWKYCRQESSSSSATPVVLICHGLETNSNSPLCKEMAASFNRRNMDAACINFRGCSGECNLTPRGYHVGYTDDLLFQIRRLNDLYPQRRIYLSGFSLGAGAVTKLLTELQQDAHEKYNIGGAAVSAVPFDLSQCSSSLNEDGFAKRVYGDRILRSVKGRMHRQYDVCEFPFAREEIDRCNSIMDVENLAIASTFGFDNAWDYYDKCKTIDVLDRVWVPQYVLQSLDDPFFEGMRCPENNPNLPVHIHYTDFGGHCGYVFQTEETDDSEISWMPLQLGRFLAHVEGRYARESSASHKNTQEKLIAEAVRIGR